MAVGWKKGLRKPNRKIVGDDITKERGDVFGEFPVQVLNYLFSYIMVGPSKNTAVIFQHLKYTCVCGSRSTPLPSIAT